MEIDFIVVKQGYSSQVQQWIKGERKRHDFDHWVKVAICTRGISIAIYEGEFKKRRRNRFDTKSRHRSRS